MAKVKKPAPSKALSATEKMIEACVRNVKARKSSGEADRRWREEYARTLKGNGGDEPAPKLSATPFDGNAFKKR